MGKRVLLITVYFWIQGAFISVFKIVEIIPSGLQPGRQMTATRIRQILTVETVTAVDAARH